MTAPETELEGVSHAPESAPEPPLSREPSPRLTEARALPLAAVVLVFFAAITVGRALEPALLGWRAGLERLIERVDFGSALLGQLAVAGGCLLAIQLLIATLVENRLNVLYRLAIAPLTAAVITLVMASATRELPLLLVFVLALLTAAMALGASIPAMIADHTRAAGFVLALAGAAALLQISARALAVWASHEVLTSLFKSAQAVSTFVFAVNLAALAISAVWLASRRYLGASIVGLAVITISALLGVAAVAGSGSPGGWLVLANKAFAALTRHPRPFVPTAVQYTLQAALLLTVPVAVLVRRNRAITSTAIAFCLLASGGTDLPVHALALALAALAGPLAAARERPELSPLSVPEPSKRP